ncbi:hypothetical protein QYN14_10030 [Rhodococcus ruber]|uniref:hypothetical protein n=1 Tax=Rhodococcus ruber TaxID=1830 RepID=UPI00265B2073|nr:hypothetical protein [Rhodococcus ruber]WKK13876.1 hypothetical protein QYN14_10030 [Rhodococcus ruber]
MTVQQLADETERLGHPLNRVVITKLENKNRGDHLPVVDLIVLAAALRVPPIQLLYPGFPEGETEYLPGVTMPAVDAALTFSGERSLSGPPGDDVTVMHLAREWRYLSELIPRLERDQEASSLPADTQRKLLGPRSKPAQLEQARVDFARIEAVLAELVDGGEHG